MYYIGNLEIFDPRRYGHDEGNTPGIAHHWMVAWCSVLDSGAVGEEVLTATEALDESSRVGAFHRLNLRHFGSPEGLTHISNGDRVRADPSYLAPQLIEIEVMPGGECVGFPRGSFWIKIFQRKWRSILTKRREIVKYFRLPRSLMRREIGSSSVSCQKACVSCPL